MPKLPPTSWVNDPNILWIDLEDAGKLALDGVRALRAAFQEIAPFGCHACQCGARLHRVNADAADVAGQVYPAGSGIDCGLCGVVIAARPDIGNIVGDLAMHHRRPVGAGMCGFSDDRCFVKLDINQQGRVTGLRLGFRDHKGNRFADIAHGVDGEDWPCGLIGGLAIRHRQVGTAGHVRGARFPRDRPMCRQR